MKSSVTLALLGLLILFGFAPLAHATPTTWDYSSGILQPLQSAWSSLVKADHFQATSTTASIFPYASSTALSASTLCLSTDCRTTWPSGGGSSFGYPFPGNATTSALTFGGITDSGLGAGFVQSSSGGVLSSAALTSGNITTALGFTPYNATNPSNYITLTGLSGGTGISYNNATGVITNSGVTSLSAGSGISVSGSTGAITISSTGGGTGTVSTSSSETANEFPYWTTNSATPALLSGTSNLYNSSGNIGVGTSSPWALLSINPNAIGAAPAFAIGSSTATNLIVTNGGLVGIGKTNPTTQLDVKGNVLADNYLESGGTTNSVDGRLYIFNASGGTGDFINGNGVSYFSAGNVGVATTSPYAPLSVQGVNPVAIYDTTAGLTATIGSLGCNSGGYIGISFSGSSGCTKYAFLGGSGQTFFNAPSVDDEFRVNNTSYFEVGPNGAAVNNYNNVTPSYPFSVATSSSVGNNVPQFVVTNAGNIGISTTTPGFSVSLSQKSTADGFQFAGQSTGGTSAGTGFLMSLGYNAKNNKQLWLGDADYIGSSTGQFIRFGIYNGVSPTLDAVSGTGATRAKLTIGVAGDANSGVILANTGVNGYESIGADYYTTAAPTNGLLVEGNVGIASTSPWGLLSVNPNGLGANVPQFVVGSSTKTNFIVANNGNVGVGTTSPGSILSIQGVANFVASGISTIFNSLSILGNLFLPSLGTPAGSFLAVNPSGQVIATSTPGAPSHYYATSTTDAVAAIPVVAGNVVQIWVSGLTTTCANAGGAGTFDIYQSGFGNSASTTIANIGNHYNSGTFPSSQCSVHYTYQMTATTTETWYVEFFNTSNLNLVSVMAQKFSS